MMASDTKTPLERWIEDWKETFQTSYSVEDIDSMVGQNVKLTRPGNDEEFEFLCIGYSKSIIKGEGLWAEQLSIITEDGKMISLRSGVILEVVTEEDDDG